MFIRRSSSSIAVLLASLALAPAVLGARVVSNMNRKGAEHGEASQRSELGSEADPLEVGLLQQNEVMGDNAIESAYASSNLSSVEETEFTPKCPKLYQTQNVVPNAVFVKVVGATNLGYSFTDEVDPYVRFWMGDEKKYNGLIDWKDKEKKWLGKTHYIWNNRDPQFNFGCTFFYSPEDASTNSGQNPDNVLHAVVMDRNVVTSDTIVARIGKKGESGGVSMTEILAHDTQLDGEFDVSFTLYGKSGKKSKGRKQTSTLMLRFQVLRDTSKYMLTKARRGHHGNVGHIE